EGGGWHCPSGWLAAEHAVPIARIPDPPAPEPTEAEKIDARRADALYKAWCNAGSTDYETRCRLFAEAIRASDEAAGYVTVPTSGPGFERMVSAAKEACPIILTDRFGKALRAAIEA